MASSVGSEHCVRFSQSLPDTCDGDRKVSSCFSSLLPPVSLCVEKIHSQCPHITALMRYPKTRFLEGRMMTAMHYQSASASVRSLPPQGWDVTSESVL